MAEIKGSTVVIGGTSGIGHEIARHYADAGGEVVVTSREANRAADAADRVGGRTRGVALDLAEPETIADALADVGEVAHLVLSAIDRDNNTVRDYDIAGGRHLTTLKLVGYTETVHTLLPRMHDDSSIVLFGGLAKDRPYPGSTTVSTVNGGVVGMVTTMAVELAPIRVNGLHPAIVGDSPFWEDKPQATLDALRQRTPLGKLISMADVVHATAFLLENRAVNGINLELDGGWLRQ